LTLYLFYDINKIMAQESGHDIEIWYGLGGGEPFLIGGGSFEDADKTFEEGDQLALDETRPGHATSPKSDHFYETMARTAGVTPQYEAAKAHYGSLTAEAEQKVRDSLLGSEASE
jgi:hypothetical protein